MVLGAADAQPLDFWVAVPAEEAVQREDVVMVRRELSNGASVTLGVILIGRLDIAESQAHEYGFLPAPNRARAGILKPGTVIVCQPESEAPVIVTAGKDPFRGF